VETKEPVHTCPLGSPCVGRLSSQYLRRRRLCSRHCWRSG
jgi:hypothetical protein